MVEGDKVRVKKKYAGPWHSLRGKTGEVTHGTGWETLTPVEFGAKDLWYIPAEGESRVFYFRASDLEKEQL